MKIAGHGKKYHERIPLKRGDILLFVGLLAAVGVLWASLWFTREPGASVSVRIGGDLVVELPLDRDTRVELGFGAHTNTLVIEHGKARVIEASCPDQICVNQGTIRYDGESIVCLPNQLIVTVEGGKSNGVDGSTGR